MRTAIDPRGAVLGLVLALLAGSGSPARAGDRFRVAVSGGAATSALRFGGVLAVREFVEDGSVDLRYVQPRSRAFEASLRYQVFSRLGVEAAYARTRRAGTARFSASLPHPFFFNRPRSAEGEFDASLEEGALHLDLVATGRRGALEIAALAGVSRFALRADVVQEARYRHVYPYDSVTFDPATTRARDNPVGFNVGGRADYRLGKTRNVGVGAQARWSRARTSLSAGAATMEFDAGGLQVTGGVRVFF
jgi:hypothetical protein